MNLTDQQTVTLEHQQWNVVRALLAEGPFRIVLPLMQEIERQLMAEPSMPHHPRTNGEARENPL